MLTRSAALAVFALAMDGSGMEGPSIDSRVAPWTGVARVSAAEPQPAPTAAATPTAAAGAGAPTTASAAPLGRWQRGNLHTHSLWSDGNDFPEMIVDWYKRAGYQFLALSDHNILSTTEKWIEVDALAKRGAIGGLERYRERFGNDWVETREKDGKRQVRLKTLPQFRGKFEEPGRFQLLQGEEITDHVGDLPIHINASNLLDLIRPQGGKTVREAIANNIIAVQAQAQRIGQPILAHLNHPNFGWAVTAEDMAAVVQERFFEVYNGHPGVNHRGDKQRAGTERMWDIANTIRLGEMQAPPLFGLATDDSHNYFGERGASPGRGWIMVRCDSLEPSALVHAIEAGQFYASSGVELSEVQYDEAGQKLSLRIVEKPGVTYTTEFIGTRRDYDRKNEPVLDADGKPIVATRRYSADVGRVLATAPGTAPQYQFKGDELFVRAVVTASAKPANPAFADQFQQAWTQPMGWKIKSSETKAARPDVKSPSKTAVGTEK
ncbi:MAG: hypothetical protein ACKO38_17585 [Planctomycetota bacterium]